MTSRPDFPLFNELVVETIGSCNRTCPSCLRQSYPRDSETTLLPLLRTVETQVGRGEKMPAELFRSIVDQSSHLGFIGKVVLQFFNEPLLDDRIVDLAAYVREQLPQSQLVACTNADLLDQDLAAKLDSVFHGLNVSLYMPEDRQRRRRAEIRSMFSKCRLVFRGGLHGVTHFSPAPELASSVERARDQPCTAFNRMLIVNATGDVSFCCEDVAADFGLGNVRDIGLREIWFGQRNREIVEKLSRPGGRRELAYCANCPRPERGSGRRRKFRVNDLERSLADSEH